MIHPKNPDVSRECVAKERLLDHLSTTARYMMAAGVRYSSPAGNSPPRSPLNCGDLG